MSYFKDYQDRELYIVEKWIDSINIKSIISSIERANTGFHDIKIVFNNNFKDLIIEVKEDESYWYERTGNIGFDYISAFQYKNIEIEEFVKKSNLWIKPEKLEYFLSNIIVQKWGKLVTCDAHIQLFYVEKNNRELLLNAYPNKELQRYLKKIKLNYNMRINNKKDYASKTDNWESSAYFINPNKDQNIINMQIKNIDDISRRIK